MEEQRMTTEEAAAHVEKMRAALRTADVDHFRNLVAQVTTDDDSAILIAYILGRDTQEVDRVAGIQVAEYDALDATERAAYDYHGQRGHDHAACMEAALGELEGPYCERAECGNPLSFDDQQAGDGLCEYCAESEQEEADAEPTAEQLRADVELGR